MSGLTVVTGAAATGKTGVLLDVAARHYGADAFAPLLVLVPTQRHADQFRRRLVARVGVAVGLDATTFGFFARRHVASESASESVAPVDVARELLERIIVERAATPGADASRFHLIAATPGLAQLVASAIGELVAEGVAPDRFREAARTSGDADLAALSDVYEAYRSALARRGWRAPEELPLVAAETLAEAGTAGLSASVILIDGVQFLRAGEVALVASLASHADVWMTLDPAAGPRAGWTLDALRDAVPEMAEQPTADAATPEGPSTLAEASTAADDEAQLREIARAIKVRLAEDATLRPSDIAVTFRRVTPHLPLARQVFAEFALPLDPAAGDRLAQRPFGAWLLRFLRLGAHGWRTADIVQALRTGFCDTGRWELRDVDLDRLLATARQQRLWSSLADVGTLAAAMDPGPEDTSPVADERRAAGLRWAQAVEALGALLDPAAERTAAAHARWLDDALFGTRGIVPSRLDDYATLDQEVSVLRRELLSFRAVEETLGGQPVTFEGFVAALEGRMQRPATVLREAGGVLLAPMHTLHGLRFRHLYVGGLSEGEFPAPPRATALLDRPRREALAAAGLTLPPEARASEDDLWQTTTSRADESTSLWRPRLSGRRPAAASYYFTASGLTVRDVQGQAPPERAASVRELAIALTAGWPGEQRRPAAFEAWAPVVRVAPGVEQRRRSFASAGPHEGALVGLDPRIDVGRLVSPDTQWSPSRLESYRTCSFQFFGGYVLGLSEVDEESTQADAATRGTVMHLMLDDAIAPLVERGEALDHTTVDETVERLRTRGRAIWDEAPRTESFGRAGLWRYEADQALDQLEAMVRREAEINATLGVTSVVGGEERFEATLEGIDPPFRIGGRADRVDAGPGLIQIVDYKTGRPIERRDVVNGKRLQLQAYALAARARWGDVRLVARYAFLRPPNEDWWLDTDREEDRALLDEAAAVAADVREAVEAGAFQVAPQVPECPSYCAFIHVCRVNTFSRTKTWDPFGANDTGAATDARLS